MVLRRQLCLIAITCGGHALLAPGIPASRLGPCRAGFGAAKPKPPSKKNKAKSFATKQSKREADRIAAAPQLCPCHSGLAYAACCKPCHVAQAVTQEAAARALGALLSGDKAVKAPEDATAAAAATPEALLRSRYAAFSLELPSYLAATTHPAHNDYSTDTAAWVQRLGKGLDASAFEGLRVLSQEPLGDDAHEIVFEADVRPRDAPEGAGVTLHERSRFAREGGLWYYREGLDVSSKARGVEGAAAEARAALDAANPFS